MSAERPNPQILKQIEDHKEHGKKRLKVGVVMEVAAGSLVFVQPFVAAIAALYGAVSLLEASSSFKNARKLKPKKPNQSKTKERKFKYSSNPFRTRNLRY